MEGLFSYVTSHPLDAADTYRYIDSASVNKVIRKKADTHKTDYQSIHLGKASYTVLSQITPRTTEGRVNRTVESRIDEVVFSHPGGIYEEGQLVVPDPKATQVQPVMRAQLAQLALKVQPDHRALLVNKVLRVLLDPLALKVLPAQRAQLDQPVEQVLKVQSDLLERPDQRVILALSAPQA